jgi:amino acid adenylation domain-containing protein
MPATPPLPRDAGDASVPERFRDSARRHPAALAVRAAGQELPYAGLDAAANGIAHALIDRRGPGEEPIAVLLGKSPRLIAAFLGVLAAGKAFLPLDPSFPASRLARICASSGTPLLVTESAHAELARSLGLPASAVLDLDATPAAPATDPPSVAVTAESLATILYTSGSTGDPKGVAQSHRGVLHDAVNLIDRIRVAPGDRLSLILAAGTVGSIRDILAALLTGASVHPFDLPAEGFAALGRWISDERITYVNVVVTLFRHLVAALPGRARLDTVRVFRCGSEALAAADVAAFRRHFAPRCVLFTGFSATETGTATWLFFPAEEAPDDGRVTAGHGAPGYEVLVLDEARRPVPPGEVGEVAIRSAFLPLGYWRRPDLTAGVFLPDPEGSDARVYLTGDLGRIRPGDGALELGGRRDATVKIHGARVDLTEIELALQDVPGVRQAAVVMRERSPGDPRAVAYVAPSVPPGPAVEDMRRHLRQRLPGYMMPAAFVTLPALPSTPGGKLDRRALPEPDWSGAAPFVAPRTPVEELLASMWTDVLSVERIGVDDTFLDLGGDSLTALRLVTAIRDRFELDLPPARLLAAPTISAMALEITTSLAERLPPSARPHLLDP